MLVEIPELNLSPKTTLAELTEFLQYCGEIHIRRHSCVGKIEIEFSPHSDDGLSIRPQDEDYRFMVVRYKGKIVGEKND
jgi:hypothetical protein